MANVSASTVFHFTNSFDSIQGILNGQAFRVQHCAEEFRLDRRVFRYLIPMVSLCDIPLTAALPHMKSYGQYGIGLSKEWARKIRLNPVLYLSQNSYLSSSLYSVFDRVGRHGNAKSTDSRFRDIFRYLKNERGPHPKHSGKTYLFLNEREWRYVPDYVPSEDGGIHILKGMTEREIADKKSTLNQRAGLDLLQFQLSDIRYIILKSVHEFEISLEQICASLPSISEHDRLNLARKYLLASQIRLDF